ncbi:hypothetical protein K488DRAFT_12445, partial [Vararia minispora EC-137]
LASVTCAARGVGRAIPFRLAVDGFDAAINDTPSASPFAEAVKEIEAIGERSAAIFAGVSVKGASTEYGTVVLGSLDAVHLEVKNPKLHYDALKDYTDRLCSISMKSVLLCYKYTA